jgi:hypothetical protein
MWWGRLGEQDIVRWCMDFATKQHPIIEAWFSEGAAWEDVVGF